MSFYGQIIQNMSMVVNGLTKLFTLNSSYDDSSHNLTIDLKVGEKGSQVSAGQANIPIPYYNEENDSIVFPNLIIFETDEDPGDEPDI